jgi:excisionase family DNA binding protein
MRRCPSITRVTYRVHELPEITGISRSTICRAIKRGELACHSDGRIAIVFATDLFAWLAGRGAGRRYK